MSTSPANVHLSARPTFTRQPTDSSQIELLRRDSRPSLSRSNSGSNGNILPQDVYDPTPQPGDNPLRPTVRERLAERMRLPSAPVPRPVRSVVSHVVDTIAANWRDLTVAGALTGLVSWAIWATVKIHKQDNMPYCVFDDSEL